MRYKRLFIWVEGQDDARFFKEKIKPIFERKYNSVSVRQYVMLKREKFDNFLQSIKEMNDDYIYVRDINGEPCVTAKKQEIQGRLNIDNNRIMVVIKEIESWYLAGLDEESSKKLGTRSFTNTDNITKAKFDRLIPRKVFDSRIDFLLEILKYFSIETAKQKNTSFRYFFEKHAG